MPRADTAERDAQIRRLRLQGWTLRRIAAQFQLTDGRVAQICGSLDTLAAGLPAPPHNSGGKPPSPTTLARLDRIDERLDHALELLTILCAGLDGLPQAVADAVRDPAARQTPIADPTPPPRAARKLCVTCRREQAMLGREECASCDALPARAKARVAA